LRSYRRCVRTCCHTVSNGWRLTRQGSPSYRTNPGASALIRGEVWSGWAVSTRSQVSSNQTLHSVITATGEWRTCSRGATNPRPAIKLATQALFNTAFRAQHSTTEHNKHASQLHRRRRRFSPAGCAGHAGAGQGDLPRRGHRHLERRLRGHQGALSDVLVLRLVSGAQHRPVRVRPGRPLHRVRSHGLGTILC
jgi:hypothetical protein